MTRASTLSVVFLMAGLAGCGVDNAIPGEPDPQGEDDDGGEDFSGDGYDDGVDDGFGGGPDDEDGGDEPGPDPADDDVLPTYPTAHPRLYLGANRARLAASLAQNTAAAARFRSTVDQWVGGANLWGFQAWHGALLGQLTGDPKYCARAITAIDQQVSAAESAAAAGQRPEVALNSYLHVGEMVGDVAIVYDWCFDATSASQKSRWVAYMNQAVSNVWNHTGSTWGGVAQPWLGWSVDNPANNYYYSFLRATMLVGLATKGESALADSFIAKFRDEKFYAQLVPAFEANLVGGGSREGTGYGVSMRGLFELYDWWHATTGERLATKTKHARASLGAFLHQLMPTIDKVAPIGDHARDMTAALFDYHRHYMQTLVALFPGEPVAGRAMQLLASSSVPMMAQPFMRAYDFLYEHADVAPIALDGMSRSYHARGIGEVYARSGWDTHATWIGVKAGAFTEDHAHQDQGSLMIYKDGWLAYDGVIDSKNGLPQGTNAHGLVRITNGGQTIRQVRATESRIEALARGDGWVHIATDVTPAYGGNAAVQRVQREIVYLEPDAIVVYDRVTTAAGTTQIWQLPTPTQPSVSGATATLSNGSSQLVVTKLSGGTMSAYDLRSDTEFRAGWRLDETQAGGDHRSLHVLGIGGAITSSVPAGADGVTMTLAGGRTVTVTFHRDAIGGTLTIDGATTALAPGITGA